MHIYIAYISIGTRFSSPPPPPKKNFLANIKKKIIHLLIFRTLFYKKNFLATIKKFSGNYKKIFSQA